MVDFTVSINGECHNCGMQCIMDYPLWCVLLSEL